MESPNFPKLAVWSLFRDNAGAYIADYIKRMAAECYPPDLLRFYPVEGDSVTPDTYNQLKEWAAKDNRVRVSKHDTGVKRYGSVVNTERFRALAKTGNIALDYIAADGWADYALGIESDLTWFPGLFGELLRHRRPVVAPLVWKQLGGAWRFYDIWAYRYLNGAQLPQVTVDWYDDNTLGLFELGSAGSCTMIQADYIYQGARYGLANAVIGLCEDVRRLGGSVWCDSSLSVWHP